jgi:uncharacterized protein YjbI with pentapeptide repeats
MSQLLRGEILHRLASGEGLRGINMVRADLSAVDLSGRDIAEANLRMADLSCADLREARLTGCFLSGAKLVRANLVGANLVEASMIGVVLKGADLSRADLSGADLTGATLEQAQLQGAYLVGTFLNETDLTGANLTGAYVRMAQMGGCNLTGASLEGADLSHVDLSAARLDGCCLIAVNLTGANLSAGTLTNCDLRGADLTGADLSGCNLTGAKLRGVKFPGIKMDDAWAEWINLGDNSEQNRASLEEVFVGIIGKPLAQVLIEGHVGDDVWAVILAHLYQFQVTHAEHSDVRLKAIHQGVSSSALYLEAERELSLAAYLAELADIIGRGSVELFEKLASAVAAHEGSNGKPGKDPFPPLHEQPKSPGLDRLSNSLYHLNRTLESRIEALQRTPFWNHDKAVAILTGKRRIWLEAVSNESLTLRPPYGAALGINLVRGHFVTDDKS